MSETSHDQPKAQLSRWGVILEGAWTAAEVRRIRDVFQRLAELTGGEDLLDRFNGQTTRLFHSGRPGRAGYTRGGDVHLDDSWTDWTLAHELGHRWNNAWGRKPQQALRQAMHAGRAERLKAPLRHLLKKLEKFFSKHGDFKGRLDWRALWYDPGKAPPPCGVDRNFNASEDLAECFAAALFPADARSRAHRASQKPAKRAVEWDWGQNESVDFEATPRGNVMISLLRKG
jgi:hypothetical protein